MAHTNIYAAQDFIQEARKNLENADAELDYVRDLAEEKEERIAELEALVAEMEAELYELRGRDG